jgi:hypothetical protein
MNDINNQSPNLIGDAYRNYLIEDAKTLPNMSKEKMTEMGFRLTQEEFINECKTDTEFSERWGLKIEERELSDDERSEIRDMQYFKNNLYQALKGSDTKIDWENIPTRLITITYNDKTIESYE